MFCKKCGANINADDQFCSKCGTKVENVVTEEFDPLLALDNENIEENVIWQEAPLDDETIITEKGTGIIESELDGNDTQTEVLSQTTEKQESNFKENTNQGIRAAKSTIANPIKPRKRIKPKTTPKPAAAQEQVILSETPKQEQVTQEIKEVNSTPEETQQVIETIVTEEIVEETPVTQEVFGETTVNNDDVVDIFDDFVVDDSASIVEETPIIEEAPVVEEAPIVEEAPVVDEAPVFEESLVIEETPVVEEAPVFEEITPQEPTPEPVIFEEEISEPINTVEAQEISATPEPDKIIYPIHQETNKEEVPQTIKTTATTEQVDLEQLVNQDNDEPILDSISQSKVKRIIKEDTPTDDVFVEDDEIRSKFNTKLEDELNDEVYDVDENINSLTSRITTILIIILVLIIAVVVATFLVQNIGL